MRDKTDHCTIELPGFESPAGLALAPAETRRARPSSAPRPPQLQEALRFGEAEGTVLLSR